MAVMERYISERDGEELAVEIKKRALVKQLTKAEYEALTEAEKMNGTVYFVTDDTVNPNTLFVPTKVSELENDSGYVTADDADIPLSMTDDAGTDKTVYVVGRRE